MQQAVELEYQGRTLRGMAHVPVGATEPVPAVIILHGFTADKLGPHQIFVKLSRMLVQAGIASFRFDFSGSGESDGAFQNTTVSGEVSEADAILNWARQDARIDPNHIALIGHSMGGLVASIVAASRPLDVSQLVLIAPAGNLREFVLSMAQQALAGAGRTTAEHDDGGLDVDAEVFDLDGNLVGRSFAIDLFGLDAYQLAKPYTGPVLLVHGSDDSTVPVEVSRRYQAEVYGARAQVHVIEGANHTFDRHTWESEVLSETCRFLTQTS